MDFGGGCNQGVQRSDGVTGPVAPRDNGPPGVRDGSVNRQHPALEAERQFVSEPGVEPASPAAGRQTFDPVTELTEGDNAEEDSIFIDIG